MGNKAIVILEDEELIANELADLLNDLGYEIKGNFRTPEALFEFIDIAETELVLLDISLNASLDGVDCGHLLNTKYQLPFIYISSHMEVDIIDRVKHTNPLGFIGKPFTKRTLQAQLNLALHKL